MKLSPAQHLVITTMKQNPDKPIHVSNDTSSQLHVCFSGFDGPKMRASTIYTLEKMGLLVERSTDKTPWYRTDYYLVEEAKQ